LKIRFADGRMSAPLRVIYVGKPINAGFFFTAVNVAHRATAHRPVAVELVAAGRVVERATLTIG
jgi:hypothetical protein